MSPRNLGHMAENSRIYGRNDEGIPSTAECLGVIGAVVVVVGLVLAAVIKLVGAIS